MIVVLFAELVGEACLLGCLLGILVSSQTGLVYGVVVSALAVPVVLFLHGYYITRALAGMLLRIHNTWLYPAIAAALFVAHMYFALARSNSDLTPFAQAKELPFLAGGACIVFACAFIGDRLLRKWTRRGDDTSPRERGTVPSSAGGRETWSSSPAKNAIARLAWTTSGQGVLRARSGGLLSRTQ